MGLVLDTGVLVVAERRLMSARQLFDDLIQHHGDIPTVLSVVSVFELTHGIYRARIESEKQRRQLFMQDLCQLAVVLPVTLDIAQIAGQIDGEQAAVGNVLPFQDLLIGVTALTLGFAVLTNNLRHFRRIPGLTVVAA